MPNNPKYPQLTHRAILAARPGSKEYTLWDRTLSHFGLRVQPTGARSFVFQVRVHGRMRKFTLGRFPDMGVTGARKEAAELLGRIWAGEAVAPTRKVKPPLFRDFAARYRERRKYRFKPSTLETHDIYLKNRLLPAFGRLRLDTIDHARVSAWFDAASATKPGAANRSFEILRAMLKTAREWGELGGDVPDACANIVMNPKLFVPRHLNRQEIARLGKVLDARRAQRSRSVAALELLMLTGARLSEILNLRWEELGELSGESASARIEDSKTGPRTIWLGSEAVRLLSALPKRENDPRVFPKKLTSARLYTFWTDVREKAELPRVRIHDLRHSFASQGVMNGLGLPTLGRLLGHRRRATTAIYAHLDDDALQDSANQVASVIAAAMQFGRATPQLGDSPRKDREAHTGSGAIANVKWSADRDRSTIANHEHGESNVNRSTSDEQPKRANSTQGQFLRI